MRMTARKKGELGKERTRRRERPMRVAFLYGDITREISLFPRQPQCTPLRASTKPYSRNGKIGRKGRKRELPRGISFRSLPGIQMRKRDRRQICLGVEQGSDRNRFATRIFDRGFSSRRRGVPRDTCIDVTGAGEHFGGPFQ